MLFLHYLACFAGAVMLINGMPYLVCGVTDRAFQMQLAKSPGNASAELSGTP